MKYLILIADGMADEPQKELGGCTPLAYAKTNMLDTLALRSKIGRVKTIPDTMEAGSDIAALTILGYDAKHLYTGRAPLECVGLMEDNPMLVFGKEETAYRMNLVTLSEEETTYEQKRILDHTAENISTEEAKKIMQILQNLFDRMAYQYYTETSYRHLLVGKRMKIEGLVPPHNILGDPIGNYLPKDPMLNTLVRESYHKLNHCFINEKRRKEGKLPANSIWLWGGGTSLQIDNFYKKYEKRGAMISAVAVLKGIARSSGMTNLTVSGATGTVHTDYRAKAKKAIQALLFEPYDFVCLHIEAPDEASHRGDVKGKVHAIEQIDEFVIKPIIHAIEQSNEEVRVLILPDHYTLVQQKKHVDKPVPYLLYDSRRSIGKFSTYNEEQANSEIVLSDGTKLIEQLFSE